ncbi:Endoribonuclease L-PSP [Myxococcus hansupus]|uniref:Endoribonuclease L-PSP n=1 Tax=Pseudomyxococcus hansupus TaxID=1297742 RepID=A0A0H4WM02_9BACT|nr:RidA family protein [Myxococcus hansupus]AKQ63789.1 Endoribonuclease L-PSP [Myxococcus hansupus]
MKAINPPDRAAPEFYSQAIEVTDAKRTLYISGQVGVAPDGSVPEGIEAQARQALANLNALLEQAGMTNRNIVKTTIYLTDAAHLPGFMAAGAGTLASPPPATTLLIVKALAAPPLLIEIEAIAVG